MGIKNLIHIINKTNAIKTKSILDYKNKVLGIDANLMIYKIVYAIRKNGYDIKNNGMIVTHIHGFLRKLVSFKKYNIGAIFVFDGLPPKLKEQTMINRKKIKMALSLKYEKAMSQDEKKRYYYHKSDITSDEIFDVMNLIRIFGFPIIESKNESEADIVLAELSNKGMIDAIVTDDMDILVFGGNHILKNFSIDNKKKFQEISLTTFLSDSQLTLAQLIDIAILIGCDYCDKSKGVGPITAYNLIKEYGSISKLVKNKIIDMPTNYKEVKQLFEHKTNETNKFKYKEMKINFDQLEMFLNERSFKDKYVEMLKNELNN